VHTPRALRAQRAESVRCSDRIANAACRLNWHPRVVLVWSAFIRVQDVRAAAAGGVAFNGNGAVGQRTAWVYDAEKGGSADLISPTTKGTFSASEIGPESERGDLERDVSRNTAVIKGQKTKRRLIQGRRMRVPQFSIVRRCQDLASRMRTPHPGRCEPC
jgi:hypothetical protein